MMAAACCNITDRLFIGDSLGTTALAGLALTLPFMVLLTSVGSLTGTGASILIAKAMKKQDVEQGNSILGNAFILSILLSVALILLLTVFHKRIVLLFGGRADTLPYALQYLNIIIPGSIFTNLAVGFCNCMRVCGFATKAALIILGGILLNALLNAILFSCGWLSIGSTACTTVFSMFVCASVILFHFTNRQRQIRLQTRYFHTSLKTAYKIILTGMTPFFMNLTICTVSIIMNNYLVIYGGTPAIGAYGIISSYTILLMMTLAGFCQGMQIGIRSNIEYNKTKLLRKTLYIGAIVTCIGFLAGEFFSEYFVGFFTADAFLRQQSATGLRIILCTLPVLGFQLVIASFFQSIDKTRKALFINMSRQFIFLIPSLFIFSDLWGVTGIWIAIPFADLMATAVTCLILYIEKRKWHKQQRIIGVTA